MKYKPEDLLTLEDDLSRDLGEVFDALQSDLSPSDLRNARMRREVLLGKRRLARELANALEQLNEIGSPLVSGGDVHRAIEDGLEDMIREAASSGC
jgi:hypothetical protein